ncbi:patatin-like phospholipase family protein [Accumulibacter sp.]|uniref:patatin-like phospholipase family protein n=1 Tax=Accumulibacter sp. TaxID=2053492 RepID=UPI00262E77B1|nr:patatin-like phospholipase family protein [Accumulibacter sp.]
MSGVQQGLAAGGAPWRVLLAAWMLFSACAVAAQQAASDQPKRPRVGLVLGGGGARGAAHIGVLEVLEKLRVPVDCVAGTSMGALVAGVYASGLSPATMRSKLAEADWDDLFRDDPPLNEQNFRKKVLDKRFLPGSETGVGPQGVKGQPGIVMGQKIKLFFNLLVRDYLGERKIEALPLPLSIIATDIVGGERVVFRQGSLSEAMRASMSVPGLMAPVETDGKKLVDGGLVDNVPIDEARARCQADVIIAVNVGSPLLKAEDISGLLSVSAQMVNILTEQNVTRSLATLKPTDIYIKPDLEGITAGDFKRSSETADRGVTAAEAVADRLRTLAVSETAYAAWTAEIQPPLRTAPRVDEVQIAGLKLVNPAVIERYLQIKPGDTVDPARIDADLMRAYGDGYYEHVDYALDSTLRDREILRVLPVEKGWGPDYLRFGINLDSNFRSDSTYSIRAAYQKTWLNSLGAELLTYGEFGSRNGVGVDFYQPLDARQRYFVEANANFLNRSTGIYENDNQLAQYSISQTTVRLASGMNVGLLGQARLGWQENWRKAELETGSPTLPQQSETYGGWFAALDFDQTDRIYFPTSGWSTSLKYFDTPAKGFSKLDAGASAYLPIGEWVIASRLSYQGSPIGKLPSYDLGQLGGMLNMTPFAVGQLKGDDMSYGSIRAERIIGRLPLGLRGDLRLGAALETAKVGRPFTETTLKGWIPAAAVYLGGETPFGPIYLGYGYSNAGTTGGYSNFYLFLGTP